MGRPRDAARIIRAMYDIMHYKHYKHYKDYKSVPDAMPAYHPGMVRHSIHYVTLYTTNLMHFKHYKHYKHRCRIIRALYDIMHDMKSYIASVINCKHSMRDAGS